MRTIDIDILNDLLAFEAKHNKDELPSEEVLKKREKSRKNTYSWREKNREEYNAYMLPIAKAYYQKNKERINKLTTIRNQKKREKERLESLGEIH
jgi:hypothetical protein